VQQRHKLPNGRIVVLPADATPDEVQQVIEAEMAADSPPPRPQGNVVQRGLEWAGDQLRNAPDIAGMGTIPNAIRRTGNNMVGGFLGGTLAHPVDNAPDTAALVASLAAAPFTAGMSIPAGIAARSGVAAGAGGIGSYLRGDDAETVMSEGLKQLLYQLVPDAGMAKLAPYFRSGSRAATNTALRPGEDVLNQMRDASGKPLANYKDRADVFAEGALDRGGKFSPGTSGFHKATKAPGDIARGEKVTRLAVSPLRVTTQDILDEAAPRVRDIASGYGRTGVSGEADSLMRQGQGPTYQPSQIDEAVNDILERSVVAQGPLPPGIVTPPMVQTGPDTPWSMLDIDAKAGSLGKELSKDYTQLSNAAATRRGARAPEINTDVDMAMRDTLSAINKRVPGVAALDDTIAHNVPFESAAHDATMPEWGQLLPRPRVTTRGTGMPQMSLFGYATRKGAGSVARPLRALSENAGKIGRGGAHLARLVNFLMQEEPDSVTPSGTVNTSGYRRP
jgi:hypothetical protein